MPDSRRAERAKMLRRQSAVRKGVVNSRDENAWCHSIPQVKKEGKVRRIKSLWIMGICALVFCGQMRTLSQTNQIDEILIDPSLPEEVSARLRQKISDDHVLLDELFPRIRGRTDAELEEMVKKEIPDDFIGTYLKNPQNMQTNQRGWGEVIRGLRDIAEHPNISKTTRVRLFYKPYKGASSPEDDIDLVAIITTTLSGSPDIDLGGCLEHRRLCEFYPCGDPGP